MTCAELEILICDYVDGTLSKEDLLNATRMVESYVFRRAVSSIPTNSMNKTFATFGRALKKDRYFESIQAHFMTLAQCAARRVEDATER